MEVSKVSNPHVQQQLKTEHAEAKERLVPSGAIAFFIALVVLCLAIWFGIYFLMLERI